MQKKIIALAIAGLASTAAFAQTNVTVYGIADVGYVYSDHDAGDGRHGIQSGVLSTSRIGFKGVEDLGNGLKALFTLEYGLAVDANTGIGTGGATARQQFVGVTGGFGTVVAGRLQTTGLDFTTAGSALGGSPALGAINQVNGGSNLGAGLINAASRANSAIAYISPSFGGVTLAINHAREPLAQEAAADNKKDDATATLISASYANGPLTAGLVYGVYNENDSRVLTTAAGGFVPATMSVNAAGLVTGTPAVSNFVVDKVKETGIRAGYDLGVAKLQAAYQRQNVELVGNGDVTDNKWVVSATVPVGAKAAVIAEYAQAKVNDGDDKNKAFTVAGTYSLSKRTTAYAGFVGVRPDAKKTDNNIYALGVRHAF